MCTWILAQSLWTDIPIMPLPLIKNPNFTSLTELWEKEMISNYGWERGIRFNCLIPSVGNSIHSFVSEYLFYPTSFKSRWKSRPSDSNNIMKQNYNYYFLQTVCYGPNPKLLKSTDWHEWAVWKVSHSEEYKVLRSHFQRK